MATGTTHFSSAAIRFLRGLARNNDREWFNERKPVYERELKEPMLQLIAEINDQLAAFAPAHVRAPQKIMMRIYRDTRFSREKIPYKTHLAAWWAHQTMEKTTGGGFYLQVSPAEVVIAAGCYMPAREQLLAIRRYLLDHHEQMRALLADPSLARLARPFEGLALTRAPKGFPPDHPALDLLLQRQWGVHAQLPGSLAMSPQLVATVCERFGAMAPLVAFLNGPLAQAGESRPASFGL